MPYAAQTRVPISRAKTDIEELLAKHGAMGFAYATEGDCSLVSCTQVVTLIVGPPSEKFAIQSAGAHFSVNHRANINKTVLANSLKRSFWVGLACPLIQ